MMHERVSLEDALESCSAPAEDIPPVHQSAVHLMVDERDQDARDGEPADDFQNEHHASNRDGLRTG